MSKATVVLASLLVLGARPVLRQTAPMSFFITSAGPGKGADLGGLAGADRHCHALADAIGAGKLQWRAYLSTLPQGGAPAVNARERIGRGPWFNAKGVKVADNVADLHGDNNKLTKQNSLAETGCSTASDSAGNRNLMPIGRIGQQGAAATLLVALGAIGFLALRARGSSRAGTVPSCLTNPGATLGCYEQYYGSIVTQTSVADAFTQLKARYAGDPDAQRLCHAITHAIGRAAAQKYGDVAEAFQYGDNFCGSGY